jgi:hypothetical protein
MRWLGSWKRRLLAGLTLLLVAVVAVGFVAGRRDSGGAQGTEDLNGPGSFVGRASNAVMLVQWTRSGGTVTGSLREAIEKKPAGSGLNATDHAFTGAIHGNGITLNLSGAESTTYVGEVNGNDFNLTLPGQRDALITVAFTPGEVATYNESTKELLLAEYQSRLPAARQAVSQRAFDRARASSTDHADLPAARQIARELGLSWSEVLAVAHAQENERGKVLDLKMRGNAPKGWLTSARIKYTLLLVAGRLGVDTLTMIAYDEERAALLNEDVRDWLHGRRLRIPSAMAVSTAAHGWDAALRVAGLGKRTPRKRTIHQAIASRVEVMDRFYDHYGEQPSEAALRDFARGNRIPMSGDGGRKWPETVAEWCQRRRERGEPEPRVADYSNRRDARGRLLKAPDFSANVGAAKPDEYPYCGKWEDESLRVEWVAYYLASLPAGTKATGRGYDAWVERNPGAPRRKYLGKYEGWSAVLHKAEERTKAHGPPTGPPTPGPRATTLSTTNDDADDAGGSDDGGQDHD